MNITFYPENANSPRKRLYHPPETVISLAGHRHVSQNIVDISHGFEVAAIT